VYLNAGRIPEARAALDKVRAATGQTSPDLNDVELLVAEGRTQAARDIVVVYATKHQYLPKLQLACAYAALGEKSKALDALEQSYKDHDGMLAFAGIWAPLDPLRAEPRFQTLLTKLHLPQSFPAK
jgi:predicted Zn-dependent protease